MVFARFPLLGYLLAFVFWLVSSEGLAAPRLVVRSSPGAQAARGLGAALASQFPGAVVEIDGEVGLDDLLVSLDSDPDGSSLKVADYSGHTLLLRRLPGGVGTALFDTATLVVQRYLDEIEWRGRAPVLDPAELALPAPQPADTPPEPAAAASGVNGEAPGELFAALGAAAGLQLASGSLRAGPSLEVGWRRGGLLFGMRAGLHLPSGQAVMVPGRSGERELGELRDLALNAALQAGVCLGERWSGCGGAFAGTRATWAWSQGRDLYHQGSARSDSLLAGSFVSLSRGLPWSLEARLALSATCFVGGAAFAVEGADSALYRPSRFELALAAGLGWVFR